MSGQKGFSKKELAEQNAKVAELGREEAKLVAAIERAEKTLTENRDRLKETQRARTVENAALEQMIQRGIRAASRGETSRRAALISALLMGDDGEGDGGVPAPAPSPEPRASEQRAPRPSAGETGGGKGAAPEDPAPLGDGEAAPSGGEQSEAA
jgi:septal ring factor EnvC (AmiA/AmiB activator)